MTDHRARMNKAIESARNPRQVIADELRKMVMGEDPYTRFRLISPQIKNVWLAAAELLDEAPDELC